MTDEKTYICLTCGEPIRARFDGPVPISELGKAYYEHIEPGEYDHDPVRAPRTPMQAELDRSALQLAMYQNRLDNHEHGTVLWADLDVTARAGYLKEAKRTIGALGLLGWAPVNLRGVLYLHGSAADLKMLRETLAVAQSAIAARDPEYRVREHLERIDRLIAEIDRQRPLGPDGKHGDRHTATCGCEDR